MGLTVDVHLCSRGMCQKLQINVSNDTTVPSQGVSNDTSSPSLRGNVRVSISSSNGREWCRSKAHSNPSSGN
jgi:hypothetical protein